MSRRRIAALVVVALAGLAALAACELNPQPLPPSDSESSAAPPNGDFGGVDGSLARSDGGAGGSSSGGNDNDSGQLTDRDAAADAPAVPTDASADASDAGDATTD